MKSILSVFLRGGFCRRLVAIVAGAWLTFAAGSVFAQLGFKVERIVGGLDRPLYATPAPGDASGLYIVQQRLGGSGPNLTTGNILR
ncbi:MAG: hypothetical protein WD669_05820 [Pirellulales bacterium]